MLRESRHYMVLLAAIVVASVLAWSGILKQPHLSVSVLAAGKGNAILVRAPGGRTLLIDGGSDASILRALGTTLPEWQRSLDAVVLTNPAAAEAGGLPEVFERYGVGEFIRPDALGSKTEEAALLAAAETAKTVFAHRGDRFELGDGAYLDVLWPPTTPQAMNADDGALVVRLSYGATSFVIEKGLRDRTSAWVEQAYAGDYASAIVIGTSTPPEAFVSDGMKVENE